MGPDGREEFLGIIDEVLGTYGYSPLIARALRFFLRNPFESLVVTDREGRVVYADRGSEKVFGLPEGGAKGRRITNLVADSYLPRVLETGEPALGTVIKLQGVARIGSAFPLVRGGEVVGAIGQLFFRSLDEVERINRKISRLKREVESLRELQRDQYRAVYTFDSILGVSPGMGFARELGKKIALIDSDVLITGESGTGKELLAQAIHNYRDPERPFVWLNSPAIPFELAESELFGYERGAFSGANSAGKPGKFELAHGGTLFLDEISALPLSIQAKLLRVLQERQIERLGGTKSQRLRFRLIAASNVDLRKLVGEGKFREDLYYRVAKASIQIAPLRERREDIPIYVSHYLRTVNERFGAVFDRLSEEALAAFMAYEWPGNVRELINVLEQAALRQWEGEELPLESLPPEVTRVSHGLSKTRPSGFRDEVKEREKELALKALAEAGGNKRKAAARLGVSRSTFYKKLKG